MSSMLMSSRNPSNDVRHMRAQETRLHGVYVIDLEPRLDVRGSFTRVFEEPAFREFGLETYFPHHNLVRNSLPGTLRGLHYQVPPWGETKVIHCVSGEVLDILVDLRRESPSFRAVESFHLSAAQPNLLYVPEGLAHGYQTLRHNSTIHYLMGSVYKPEAQRGIAWDDPLLDIEWPVPNPILSDRDRRHPPLDWLNALQ